ncbi:MAG: hypothetical protein ACE10H_15425 [Candidatus Binatia bacterium]
MSTTSIFSPPFPGSPRPQPRICAVISSYAFEPDEKTLGFVADFVGEERLIFASDYNLSDSKCSDTVKSVTG